MVEGEISSSKILGVVKVILLLDSQVKGVPQTHSEPGGHQGHIIPALRTGPGNVIIGTLIEIRI